MQLNKLAQMGRTTAAEMQTVNPNLYVAPPSGLNASPLEFFIPLSPLPGLSLPQHRAALSTQPPSPGITPTIMLAQGYSMGKMFEAANQDWGGGKSKL